MRVIAAGMLYRQHDIARKLGVMLLLREGLGQDGFAIGSTLSTLQYISQPDPDLAGALGMVKFFTIVAEDQGVASTASVSSQSPHPF